MRALVIIGISAVALFLGGAASQAQVGGGFSTQCIVYLAGGTQIAVLYASSQQTCISAGPKCAAGRAFISINWYGNPVLTSSNPVESCDIPY
jgi:hypothetical protein